MKFQCWRLKIPEVLLFEPERPFIDDRGYFIESYKKSSFENFGLKEIFVQENCSWSKKNVLRGLHYQKNPKAHGKLIRVIKGEIFDVAVDIRMQSPNYGKWVGQYLSEMNEYKMIYVPPGFAHGFYALNDTLVVYKLTCEYNQECDRGILWNDPALKIDWPILQKDPILSEKDKNNPVLEKADNNFVLK